MATKKSSLLPIEFLTQLERLELATRKVFRGRLKGERRTKRRGHGAELSDFRNYAPGDDLRFLDWNMYARLDRLFLKVFLEEEDLHFYTLIDTSRSMNFGDPTKIRYATQLAAALGYIGLARADRVKVETLDQPAEARTPVFRGRQSTSRMLEFLEKVETVGSISLCEGVKNFCLRNSGQGVVLLISDLMDKAGYTTALRYLMSRRMDVYVIQILSAEELNPVIQGDLQLVDCEDHDVTDVTVSQQLMRQYQGTVTAFVGGVRKYCHARGITYLLANNQLSVIELVSSYLRQRGLVR